MIFAGEIAESPTATTIKRVNRTQKRNRFEKSDLDMISV
jgi:hypothetical protein